MAWECDYCDREFDTKKECKLHERKCRKEYEEQKKKNLKRNVLISKWILSGIMFILAISWMLYSHITSSIFALLFGLLFLPPMERFLDKKYKFKIHFILKCVLLFAFFFLLIWITPSCGDNSCNGNENSLSCFQDCGGTCGDGTCSSDETKCSCVEDCGECVSDNVCEQSFCENNKCVTNFKDNCCGNNKIEVGETCLTCAKDVKCENSETCVSGQCVSLNWECSSWSGCKNDGLQTRKCIESHGLTENKPSETQKCEYIPTIGEKIIIGNFEYILRGIEEQKYIGDAYFLEEANGIFYILEFTIKNIGKEQDYIPLDQILILDSDGKEYSYDTSSNYYLYDGIGSYEKLNPDVSLSGRIAYDVPEGLKGMLKIGDGDYSEPVYKFFRW